MMYIISLHATHTCYPNAPLQWEGLSSVCCLFRTVAFSTIMQVLSLLLNQVRFGCGVETCLGNGQSGKNPPPYHGLASLWHLGLCLVLGPSIVKKATGNGPFCVRGSFSFGPCANTLGNALSLLVQQFSWPLSSST